jgi:hypothetical protein
VQKPACKCRIPRLWQGRIRQRRLHTRLIFKRCRNLRASRSVGLLQKSPKHEKQRLGTFDLVIELKTFVERFWRLNKFQKPCRGAIARSQSRTASAPRRFRSSHLSRAASSPRRVNSPFVQNSQTFCSGELSLWCVGAWILELRLCQIRALHKAQIYNKVLYMFKRAFSVRNTIRQSRESSSSIKITINQ